MKNNTLFTPIPKDKKAYKIKGKWVLLSKEELAKLKK